ncbi:AraC family transcriptional regulator [Paenibacillus silvisoli]|uniref:AraC family transcriptional regulator n=1 Tax=Paenibacillus silvisoli TaxID=3110539 RepID=UPI002804912F|nr:AraC family transcriptional regulator [Paenibacillus silvisoli]
MILKPIDMPRHGLHLYESKHQIGSVVEPHHHCVHQLLYVLEGEGTVTLDQKKARLSKDKAVFIVPHCNHAIASEGRLTTLVLAFDSAMLQDRTLDALLSGQFPSSSLLEVNPLAGSEIRQLLRKMLFEHQLQHPMYEIATKLYLQELLLILARSRQSAEVTDSNYLRAERIRNYMDTHYFEKLSAEDIAEKLGITVRYVNDIFKSRYGITPTQYLSEIRVEAAKKMLVETDKDIVSIVFEVGYETLSTFYRNFKNIVNMSPNHYRQMFDTEAGSSRFQIREASSRNDKTYIPRHAKL